MSEKVARWIEENANHVAVRQRERISTSKLVVTFATAIAAGLAGTMLQVVEESRPLWVCTALLGLGLACVFLVILLDRLVEPDVESILQQSQVHGWDENHLLAMLRTTALAATDNNHSVVKHVNFATVLNILFSSACGIVAVVCIISRNPS